MSNTRFAHLGLVDGTNSQNTTKYSFTRRNVRETTSSICFQHFVFLLGYFLLWIKRGCLFQVIIARRLISYVTIQSNGSHRCNFVEGLVQLHVSLKWICDLPSHMKVPIQYSKCPMTSSTLTVFS